GRLLIGRPRRAGARRRCRTMLGGRAARPGRVGIAAPRIGKVMRRPCTAIDPQAIPTEGIGLAQATHPDRPKSAFTRSHGLLQPRRPRLSAPGTRKGVRMSLGRRFFRYSRWDALLALSGVGIVALLVWWFLYFPSLPWWVTALAFTAAAWSYCWNLQCISHN